MQNEGIVANNSIFHGGDQTQTFVVVPRYGPLSLYTNFEGLSTANLDFYITGYNLWMISKDPYIFMITTLGTYLKWPFK